MPEAESSINDTIGQVLGLVRRRRWWIIGAACATALIVVGVALKLPDRYSSEAILLAVQQQVSQRYVDQDSTATPAAVVTAMTREVLSRSRLVGIIDELRLYPNVKPGTPPELLAATMQKDVEIEPLDDVGRNDFRAFKITFTASTPQLAQATTSRLASLFIEENLKKRGDQAERTASFLGAAVDEAKKKLEEEEQRLQDFKTHNLTELPEQQQSNFATLTDRRMQLQSTMSALSRAQEQRVSLESSISGNLTVLQSEKANLLTKFTPKHAEVVKKDREIARLQSVLEHVRKGNVGISDQTGAGLPDDPSIVQWASQADSIAAEVDRLSQEQGRLQAEITTYQNRVNLTPVREQQLAEILRDYDLYKKDYTDLLAKQLQSQQTVNLEERQEGQQFRLVDPPTLPTLPSSPKRLKICLGGLGGGIALGLALAFLIEMKKPTFHIEKEIRNNFSVPLVVAVPLLLTPREERSGTWTTAVETIAASIMILAVCAAELYVFRHG